MKACAILDTSILPAATKADMKPPPQIPSGPLPPPPSTFSIGHGGGKMEGWEAEKLQLGHKGWQEETPSSFANLCRQSTGVFVCSQSLYVPAGGSTHTHLTGGHPRELICQGSCLRVCVSRHLTGACVSVSLCGGVANRVKERRGRDGVGEQQFIKPRFNAQAYMFSVSGGGLFTTLQQSHYSVVKHGFNTHTACAEASD